MWRINERFKLFLGDMATLGKMRRFGNVTLLVIAFILGAALFAGQILKSSLRASHPAPGAMVDVGGQRMHIHCTGEGETTVLLAAGLDDSSIFWISGQPEVAEFAGVCSFDRPGLGWSERSPDPRTIDNMVAELHELLANAGVTGPLILVGHSFGAAQVEMYASRYPADVAGVLLVDAPHSDWFVRVPSWGGLIAQKADLYRTLATLESLGLLAFATNSIPARGLPDEGVAQYRAIAIAFENTRAMRSLYVANSPSMTPCALAASKPGKAAIPVSLS